MSDEETQPSTPEPAPSDAGSSKPKRRRKAKAAASGDEGPGAGDRGPETEIREPGAGSREPELTVEAMADVPPADDVAAEAVAEVSPDEPPPEFPEEAPASDDATTTPDADLPESEAATASADDVAAESSTNGSDAPEAVESSETPTADGALFEGAEPAPSGEPVDMEALGRTAEALLFAAEEPLSVREIARAAGSDSPTMRKVLKALREKYDGEKRAWDLAEVANGYRLVTRAEFYPAIQKLKTQTAQRKLTQAALETLALIAYRQPIARADIESVRGVGAGPVLRQLLEKKLIQITGRGTGLGQPLQYGTTGFFLEHFGLKNVDELPKPGEFKNA